jgi:hypothetical protein
MIWSQAHHRSFEPYSQKDRRIFEISACAATTKITMADKNQTKDAALLAPLFIAVIP